jgi:hypothetical protein
MANAQTKLKVPDFTDSDKRETAFYKFEKEGQSIIGKLIEVQNGSFGEQYVIETEEATLTVGSYGVLKSKIAKSDEGKFIKLVFKGNVVNPKTKRTYMDFDVFIK